MKQVIGKSARLQFIGQSVVQRHTHGLKPKDFVDRILSEKSGLQCQQIQVSCLVTLFQAELDLPIQLQNKVRLSLGIDQFPVAAHGEEVGFNQLGGTAGNVIVPPWAESTLRRRCQQRSHHSRCRAHWSPQCHPPVLLTWSLGQELGWKPEPVLKQAWE